MGSPLQDAWRIFRRHIPAMFGLGYLILWIFLSIFAYLFAPDKTRHANMQVLELAKLPPGSQAWILKVPNGQEKSESWTRWLIGNEQTYSPLPILDTASIEVRGSWLLYSSLAGLRDSIHEDKLNVSFEELDRRQMIDSWVLHRHFLMGTDTYGRDLFSRLLLGSRVSLAVGLLAVLISLGIGVVLGGMAGYFGNDSLKLFRRSVPLDKVIMWLISVLWSLPTLLLALAVSFVLGKGFWQLFLAIGLSIWVEVARLVRGQIKRVREMQFSEAGKTLGFRHSRVMFRHVLPNILSPIIVIAVANFGAAVLIESGLSFLGIGVEVPIPTWGQMIYEGYTYIVFDHGQWLAFYPGLALVLLIISINLIGIGLRDALDVKLEGR